MTVVAMKVVGMRVAVGIGVVVLAAGCAASAPTGPRPTAGTQTVARQPTPAHAAGLYVVDSRTLGAVVIDGQGFVLYRFDGDAANPSRSACVDACTADWLPVPAVKDLRVVGIDRQLVGQVIRPDGSAQLTLAGWPLYGYAGDRTPGDASGHRQDDRWFVIAPNGERVGQPADPGG